LGQGVAAFGIGAAGGAAAALTGGAATTALGLGSTGALAGLVGGSLGETIGGPITGIGNGIVFGDSYGMGDFVSGVLWGGVFGAGLGAWDAARKGLNPILGDIKPRNSTQDLIKVTLGGKQIEVPGLEVSATQPTDGFDIVAANQTGLYSGNGTNYTPKLLPQFSSSTLDNATQFILTKKGRHIFNGKLHPKPYLNTIAEQMGGKQNMIRSTLDQMNGKFPSAGKFELPINLGGRNLQVRGFVNRGRPIINTMFDPSIF